MINEAMNRERMQQKHGRKERRQKIGEGTKMMEVEGVEERC